jgi:uncharacterized protein
MLSRAEALSLLKEHIKNENLQRHCFATEAIMRKLAERVGADQELWGLTGLLHDLDLELTRDDQSHHALRAAQLLSPKGFPPEALQAIKAHNGEVLGIKRETPFDHALASAETVTGLIVATALVQPDKKVASVKTRSVTKRMKERRFAGKVKWGKNFECEMLGISLADFVTLSIEAMRGISKDLGL